jgi:hypothetical protein
MKKSIEVSEDSLMKCKLSLVNEIIYDKYANINGQRVYPFDLFEKAEQEDKDNIILMLLADKDDAYYHAIEILKKRFSEVLSDAEIEAHIISEREDLALERHLEEAYDYE